MNSTGLENVKMILISEHFLDNIDQPKRAEDDTIQQHIADEKCLNTYHALFNEAHLKEYKQRVYEENKSIILHKNKKYRESNKKRSESTIILDHKQRKESFIRVKKMFSVRFSIYTYPQSTSSKKARNI